MVILQPCSAINRFCCVCVCWSIYACTADSLCQPSSVVLMAQTSLITLSSADQSCQAKPQACRSWFVFMGLMRLHPEQDMCEQTDAGTEGKWRWQTWKQICYEWEENIWKRLRKTSVDILCKATVINTLGQCQWLCWLLTSYTQSSVNAIYVTLNSALCRLILDLLCCSD